MKFIQKVEQKDVPRYYEYAGQESRFNIHRGVVPIEHTGRGMYWFLAHVPATRTHWHFQNRIGGVYGELNVDDEPVATTYTVQMDAFEVGCRVLDGSVVLEPGDGWELELCGFYAPHGKTMAKVRRIDPAKRYEGV